MTSGFPGLGPYLVLIKMGGLSKKNQVFIDDPNEHNMGARTGFICILLWS